MKFKKSISTVLCASMLASTAAPVMAAPVLATFIVNGNISSQTVEAGQNVTAPAVPVLPGFTFCGFDHSLSNITANTTYTAVYVSNTLGETAIAAKKASLPAPAVTATTVANPAAAALNVSDAMKAAIAALQTPATQTAVTNVVNATVSAAQTPAAAQAVNSAAAAAAALVNNDAAAQAAAQQAALAALAALQTQQAKDAAKAVADAAKSAAADTNVQQAANAAVDAVKTAAADTNVQQAANAAVAAITPVIAPVVSALPSWATLSEGVSASGAAELYKHLKTVKGLDDATIQGNWGALMHHYSLYGIKGL